MCWVYVCWSAQFFQLPQPPSPSLTLFSCTSGYLATSAHTQIPKTKIVLPEMCNMAKAPSRPTHLKRQSSVISFIQEKPRTEEGEIPILLDFLEAAFGDSPRVVQLEELPEEDERTFDIRDFPMTIQPQGSPTLDVQVPMSPFVPFDSGSGDYFHHSRSTSAPSCPSLSSSTSTSPFSSCSDSSSTDEEDRVELNITPIRPLDVKRCEPIRRPRRGSASVDLGTTLRRRAHVRRVSKSSVDNPFGRLSTASEFEVPTAEGNGAERPPSPSPTESSFRPSTPSEPTSSQSSTSYEPSRRWAMTEPTTIDWTLVEEQLGCLSVDTTPRTTKPPRAKPEKDLPPVPSCPSSCASRKIPTERRRGFVGLPPPDLSG